MKFHLAHAAGLNLFTGYGEGYVLINQVRHTESSLLVTPNSIIQDWRVSNFEALQSEHFAQILQCGPEVVLLGTGARMRFPHPRLSAVLTNAGIGLEVMDTRAACRTYNILVAEGRQVVVALLQQQ